MKDIKELVKYDVTEAALETYRKEFLPLTINGLDDHEGYEKVKEARLFIRGERVNVEKRRVELKAQSLEYGRAVDAEAKRIFTRRGDGGVRLFNNGRGLLSRDAFLGHEVDHLLAVGLDHLGGECK